MKPIAYCRHFARLIGRTWRNRGAYATGGDVMRALYLRLSFTNLAARLVTRRPVRLRYGRFAHPVFLRATSSDIAVAEEILERGEYDAIEQMQFPADSEMNVVDLGGNIGLATFYIAERFPRARFLTVEPDADNCRMIAMNCAHLVAAARVQIQQAFVAGRDGWAPLVSCGEDLGFRMGEIESAPGEDRVCTISMRSLLKAAGFDRVHLLKCDVEGAEAQLFADCADWIQRVDYLVVEVHLPYTLERLYADLTAASWNPRVLSEKRRKGFAVCVMAREL